MRRRIQRHTVIEASTVLIADDDEDFVLLLRAALESANLANPVQSVGDGHEVLAYLTGQGIYADRQEHPLPSLLFLDVRLPRLSGFEVLRWLRHHPEFHSLHVLVLSGVEIEADAQQARQLGAEAYLVKPCNFDKLVEIVDNLRGWLVDEPQLWPT